MNNHLSFIASAFLIGCLAACSSSDDMPDNPTPVVNPDLIGQAMDDVTAEMQSSLYNCAQPGTRAQSDIDAINGYIPTVSEGFFNNAVPDDAKDVTASDAQLGAGSGTFVVPADGKTHDISINMGKAWDNAKGGFKDNI